MLGLMRAGDQDAPEKLIEDLPEELPILPLRNTVAFPFALLPLAVGIIGGATRVHPMAKLSLKILRVRNARELAEIGAAVGLVQNLAALRSLVAEGIQKGHMILHARNVAISAGAVGEAATYVANQMIREGRIGFDRATHILKQVLRGARGKVHEIETRILHHDTPEKDEEESSE